MTEFDAGVDARELPVDLPLVVVGGVLPGGEFGVQQVEVVDASAQALPGEGGQFDLGDVQPGAMCGCVVDLQPLGEPAGFDRVEGLVEGAGRVGGAMPRPVDWRVTRFADLLPWSRVFRLAVR